MKDGVLNVLKPPGMTSHDVVACLRRIYKTKKVGHAGTLDPAAAGVLPVAVGKATRLLEYMTAAEKEYRAELSLGYATDTGDDTGAVIAEKEVLEFPSEEKIAAVLQSFLGSNEQVPPMYSAVKIGGKKLYEYAREGKTIERPSRIIDIFAIRLLQLEEKRFTFSVSCSKGTYIRSLCEDIGAKLGYPATMSFLLRTRVGIFTAAEAFSLEEIAAEPEKALLPLDFGIGELPEIALDKEKVAAFCCGPRPRCEVGVADGSLCRIYDEAVLIGIGRYLQKENCIVPEKVFPADKPEKQ